MPHYADVGKSAKDLLLGNPKSGAFSFDPKLSFASSTANGVAFAVNAIKKTEKVDGTLKISYATKKYGADATMDGFGKVTVNASLSDVLADYVPGMKMTASAVLPEPQASKLGMEYCPCKEFSMKCSLALVSSPLVDVSAATEYNGFLVGGETAYDTATSALTKYNVAVGYHGADYQVAAYLTDKATVAKLAYAHSVSPTTSVGSEVTKNLASGATTFTLGYSKKLENGALAKIKLDNAGTLSTLYETKLGSGEKVAGSLQLQTTDLAKPLKYGFALDLS